eukprot:7375929-Prymnesium_polylepis.2
MCIRDSEHRSARDITPGSRSTKRHQPTRTCAAARAIRGCVSAWSCWAQGTPHQRVAFGERHAFPCASG